jgi:hypothetical protein
LKVGKLLDTVLTTANRSFFGLGYSIRRGRTRIIIAVVWMRSRDRVVSGISVAELGAHIHHPVRVQYYAFPAILISQIATGILEAVFWTDIVGTCVNLHATAHPVVDAGDWIVVSISIAI